MTVRIGNESQSDLAIEILIIALDTYIVNAKQSDARIVAIQLQKKLANQVLLGGNLIRWNR